MLRRITITVVAMIYKFLRSCFTMNRKKRFFIKLIHKIQEKGRFIMSKNRTKFSIHIFQITSRIY